MSTSKGRGPPKGLFQNGVWYCDCTPRKPAVHFEVKKQGVNKGRWFRSCQKQQTDETRCKFFLWDTDAHPREAAALSAKARTEPGPVTPSKHRSSPPPPYTVDTGASGSSRKRAHISIDSDDEYGLGQMDNAFNNELRAAADTPSKAAKTSEYATPSTRRKLPWQMDQPSKGNITGLQTPQTGGRAYDALGSRLSATSSRHHDAEDDTHQTATPSSSFETPTPNRFRNIPPDDLTRDVFELIQDNNVRLPADIQADLKDLLLRNAKNIEGLRRGRDVSRSAIKAKEAKITELTYRVSTLEAELEAEKAMVTHLQWEAGLQEP
ncbi:hypothetical protein HBI42_136190 [Parastagonospora nodorum]|nr:hypothetical protein HBI79_080750 [Parastagonospora nodorum]KAH6214439.1 hypothetical protein HBI43_135580 [Parastagonospora nodorum]KAH6253596.1 hypothetical protein HBI42_136190 [Parastagonospora nodorum]